MANMPRHRSNLLSMVVNGGHGALGLRMSALCALSLTALSLSGGACSSSSCADTQTCAPPAKAGAGTGAIAGSTAGDSGFGGRQSAGPSGGQAGTGAAPTGGNSGATGGSSARGGAGSGGDGGAGDSSSGATGGAMTGGEGGTNEDTCTASERRCNPDSDVPEVCVGGSWSPQTACAYVCSAGKCVGSCVPDLKRCDSESGLPQLCSVDGEWDNQASCGSDRVCSAGECACRSDLTTCGDACVTLDTEPKHCGSCNHDCLGGECVGGKCKPHEIAAGQVQATSLAVDATHVYWMDYAGSIGNVKRVPKDGGTVETIATNLGSPGGVVASGGRVYFGASIANGIGAVASPVVYEAAADGTNPVVFADAPEDVDRVSLADGVLFWNQSGTSVPTTFFSKALGSSASPTPLASDGDAGSLIFTAAGGCVFYRTLTTNSETLRQACPGQASVPRFTSTDHVALSALAPADSAMLYFGAYGQGVMRLPLTGTGAATLVVAGTELRDVIADGDHLYYIDGDAGGAPACTTNWTLYRVAATPGSTPVTLVPAPQDCPGSLAADSTAVYWINALTGSVIRLAK